MLTEIKADNKRIAGYLVYDTKVVHVRETSSGENSFKLLYAGPSGNPTDVSTKMMCVGVCDDTQPIHNYCVVSIGPHKVGDVLAYAHGPVYKIHKSDFDAKTHRFVQKWHNDRYIVLEPQNLSPAEIGNMCSIKANCSSMGHHGCAQYIIPTSVKDAANVKFVTVGPYPRGKSTHVPPEAELVPPNNGTITDRRECYECSYIAIATKPINKGDVLLHYMANMKGVDAIEAWNFDLKGYELENTHTQDPVDGTLLSPVTVLSKKLQPKEPTMMFGVETGPVLKDDEASDPDTPMAKDNHFVMPKPIYRKEQSVIGEFVLPSDEWLDQQQSGAAWDMMKKSYDQRMLMAHSSFIAKSKPAPSQAVVKVTAAPAAATKFAAPAKPPSPVVIESDDEKPAPPKKLAGPRTPSPEPRPVSKKPRFVQESRTPSPDLNVAASKTNPLPGERASKAQIRQHLAALAASTAKNLGIDKERGYSSASSSSESEASPPPSPVHKPKSPVHKPKSPSRSPSPLPQKAGGRTKMKAGDVPVNWRGAGSAPAKAGRGSAPVMQPAAKAGRGRPARGKGK
jgi:hypothetical protein